MDRYGRVIRLGPGRPLLVVDDSPADESERADGAPATVHADADADADAAAAPSLDPDRS